MLCMLYLFYLRYFKEEHEYEAKAVERQKERRRKEEELKQAAVEKVVSGASGQVRDTIAFFLLFLFVAVYR